MTKLEAIIEQFGNALERLKEVLVMPKTDIVRDSAIKRFEFTVDLAWKMMKEYIEIQKGIICSSPKDCIREAYRQGLIEYDEDWIELINARNMTAHMYNEKMADDIYNKLKDAPVLFEKLKDSIG